MVVLWEGQTNEGPTRRQRDDRPKWKTDGWQFHSGVGAGE